MKKTQILAWGAIVLVIIILFYYFVFYPPTIPKDNNNNVSLECSSDYDCITSSCCHPNSCIKREERICNQLCTQGCRGPIDCGKGRCGCINGKCGIIDLIP